MPDYVLAHSLEGERERLRLMSRLLDPMHRRHLAALGVGSGWRCLEVGCGNGSVAQWLATKVAPDGLAVATDIDTRFLDGLAGANLQVRKLDILHDPLEEGAYDLVTARAILHHLPGRADAIARMISALKPGGRLLIIEPDFFPALVAEPPIARSFWQSWLDWAATKSIDYFVGRTLPPRFVEAGLEAVGAEGDVALFNGGSPWADYWRQSIQELRQPLLASGKVTEPVLQGFLSLCEDPGYWTMVVSFTAVWGTRPG
jgi:SAM-dependent methyltransferase